MEAPTQLHLTATILAKVMRPNPVEEQVRIAERYVDQMLNQIHLTGRLNLYWSGAQPPAPPQTVPSVGEWVSLGCYR